MSFSLQPLGPLDPVCKFAWEITIILMSSYQIISITYKELLPWVAENDVWQSTVVYILWSQNPWQGTLEPECRTMIYNPPSWSQNQNLGCSIYPKLLKSSCSPSPFSRLPLQIICLQLYPVTFYLRLSQTSDFPGPRISAKTLETRGHSIRCCRGRWNSFDLKNLKHGKNV